MIQNSVNEVKGYLHDGLAATTMPLTSPPPFLGGPRPPRPPPPLATPLMAYNRFGLLSVHFFIHACKAYFIRPPGTVDVYLGSHLRGPSADRHETLPYERNLAQKKQKITKKWVAPLKNIGGHKHAKFRSIFCTVRLWLRISPKRLNVSKSKREIFYIDSSCVIENRSREFWSTNFRDLDVRLDP